MNKEQYSSFIRLNDEIKSKVKEIFNYATRDSEFRHSIGDISFSEDKVMVGYTEVIRMTAYPGRLHFPSEFLFSDDWKGQYDSWAEKQRQELERIRRSII